MRTWSEAWFLAAQRDAASTGTVRVALKADCVRG